MTPGGGDPRSEIDGDLSAQGLFTHRAVRFAPEVLMSSRLDDLKDMRELLWTSVKAADPDKRAPLFARLESVIEQIEKLSPSAKAGDPVDEIAQRRTARGAGSTADQRRAASDKG